MKILKNKLFLGCIALIIMLLGFQIYEAYSQSTRDTQSYVSPIYGQVFLNENILPQDIRQQIISGDIIRTGVQSRAVIEWGDGSITRVGESSELLIEQNDISKDRSKITISFELFSGRTWSQVISFLGNDSSFTQKFEGFDAGVRGTVFDVDIEAGFIRASEHAIELITREGDQIIITPDTPYNIVEQVFIDIDIFLRAFQDRAWTEFNKVSDIEYQAELLRELEQKSIRFNPFLKIMEWFFPEYRILYEIDTTKSFESVEELISKIKSGQRQKVFNAVQKRYQDYNFISPDQEELYMRKVFLQKALVLLSDDTAFRQSMLERSLLDIDGLIERGNMRQLESILDFIEGYPGLVSGIDTTILERGLQGIPPELRQEFQRSINTIEEIFQIDISNVSQIRPQDILDGTSEAIDNFLEDTFGDTIRNLLR
ncbi:FecR family protein [Candidatus Gracilibacteria bacterium]|nr:FecR family protein [Candidatus Gracilibacteria bacterium]